jgi:hypothetical protein
LNKDCDKKVTVGERSNAERVTDINNIITVDGNWLNFSSTLPGKILGSTLEVANLTEAEQIIELTVDQEAFKYNRK